MKFTNVHTYIDHYDIVKTDWSLHSDRINILNVLSDARGTSHPNQFRTAIVSRMWTSLQGVQVGVRKGTENHDQLPTIPFPPLDVV